MHELLMSNFYRFLIPVSSKSSMLVFAMLRTSNLIKFAELIFYTFEPSTSKIISSENTVVSME